VSCQGHAPIIGSKTDPVTTSWANMRQVIAAVLILTTTPVFAECRIEHSQQRNTDGSAIRIRQKQCEDSDVRAIRVQLKPAGSTQYTTVLRHTQSVEDAGTGGGRLRDIDGDGVFEYEEIGACGTGPNCEGWIFKIKKDQRSMYLFFHDGYADFRRMSNYYVTSVRASCCSWEHHVYIEPQAERSIGERDFLYSITADSTGENRANGTPCYVSKRIRGKWVSSAIPDKRLLELCEIYGTSYIINPPAEAEDR
jgi:hypothetical protein